MMCDLLFSFPPPGNKAIGTGGAYYDEVDFENTFVSDCKATCEAVANCGGFSLMCV